jgi:hypothetical protein
VTSTSDRTKTDLYWDIDRAIDAIAEVQLDRSQLGLRDDLTALQKVARDLFALQTTLINPSGPA